MKIVEKCYGYVSRVADDYNLCQTAKALQYAWEKHDGMLRKGPEQFPYIFHPLTMAEQAISLGLIEDDLIAAALLHDVCEDCGVLVEELPVNDAVKHSVALLTKKDHFNKDRDNHEYYEKIATDRVASLVKIMDRCNNVSSMASAFSLPKMKSYCLETKAYVFPLIETTRENYPDTEKQLFLLEYHLRSVIDAILHVMDKSTFRERTAYHEQIPMKC